MMHPRRMRELIVLQLRQYNTTRRMMEEYEALGLKARPAASVAPHGGHGDPTAAEAMRLLEPDENIRRMRGWLWAIDEARALLLRDSPCKAELMELLFFEDTGDTASDSAARRELLVERMHISEPTLYRWRNDIIQAVMAGAIEAGVLTPYGRALPRAKRE